MSTTKYAITIVETGEVYYCYANESLLRGMERLGKKGIPVGCRGGGCGVCKVQIIAGVSFNKVMSREHVREDEEKAGCGLACRMYPRSDMTLSVVGKMQKNVCRTTAQVAEMA